MEREDWNRRYAARELIWTAQPNRFLVEEVSALSPGRALDLAAGEGRNAVWLAERGWQVVAADFSNVALDKGRELARARNVEIDWQERDVRDWEPPRGFDLVVVLYLHLPWSALEGVLRRAARAVAPGGTFLLVGHDAANLERGHGGPPDPRVLYSADQVAAVVGQELSVLAAKTVERPVQTETGTEVALDCLVRAERKTA